MRVSDLDAVEPHSLPLQFLAETGLVGALLAGGAALAAALAALGALRRAAAPPSEPPSWRSSACPWPTPSRASSTSSGTSWPPPGRAMLVTGVLLTAGGQSLPPRRHGLWAFAPPLAAAALLYSLAAPWLAERRVERAYGAVANGDPAAAVQAAESARGLNPLSARPASRRGERPGPGRRPRRCAAGALVEAAKLQPENPATWYELGVFELRIAKRPEAAIEPLERVAELDPYGDAPRLLAEARRATR